MNEKTKKAGNQAQSSEPGVVEHMGQMLMPMVAGIASTKVELTKWLHPQGLERISKPRMNANARK